MRNFNPIRLYPHGSRTIKLKSKLRLFAIKRLDENLKELQELGFKVIFAENFHYFEDYPSYEEFDLFLQGVPIFEDFDSEKDKAILQKYVKKFSTNKGITLSRHRLVMVVQKVARPIRAKCRQILTNNR